MEKRFYVGVDVSKHTLDFAVVHQEAVVFHQRVENSVAGVFTFVKSARQKIGFSVKEALFCMEHTGIYNNILMAFLHKRDVYFWLERAIQIKQSVGLKRGKNDKLDAQHIALYCWRFRDLAKRWEPNREVITRLKALNALRTRMISAVVQLKTPLQEAAPFISKTMSHEVEQHCMASICSLEKDISAVDEQIQKLIDGDPQLKKLFSQVTSVEGIGKTTGLGIILTTNEFKDFTEPKSYACYAGVAPFEHTSGSSIRGKNRVSPLANKKMKTLLHLAAMTAVRMNGELKEYYLRKVTAGKNKMSVLNAVRNKLIQRVFAVVRDDRMFEKSYQHSFVMS